MDDYEGLVELGADPELVISIKCAGQGSVQAFLGDKIHGYLRMRRFPSFGAAVDWLRRSAYQYYPHSQYVQQHPVVH
jgi:hypothetical protein